MVKTLHWLAQFESSIKIMVGKLDPIKEMHCQALCFGISLGSSNHSPSGKGFKDCIS